MKNVGAFLDRPFSAIAKSSAALGQRVLLSNDVLDRSDSIDLAAPGLISPNGSCRLLQTRDGWIAVNLPRMGDIDDVPALLGEVPRDDPWQALTDGARTRNSNDLVAQAELLGLALARVGETPMPPALNVVGVSHVERRKPLRVIDLSSLWAGPLCGSVFVQLGADVTKIQDPARPDPTPIATPPLARRLNDGKRLKQIALHTADGQAELLNDIVQADVLITSARARGLAHIGVTRERVLQINPALVWLSITGHGWDSSRIAFGDDAAASGNLLSWEDGAPRFLGDALADPLTGVTTAAAGLELLAARQNGFVDAALARVAAFVAAQL